MTNISFSRQRYLAKIDLLLSGIYNVFAFSFKGFIIWFGRVLVSLTFTSMKLRWLFTFNIYRPSIIFIFRDFLMFYQILLSPQVKRSAIISLKHGIYELPHELANDLRLLRILGN